MVNATHMSEAYYIPIIEKQAKNAFFFREKKKIAI
jgi:hypothetical protein